DPWQRAGRSGATSAIGSVAPALTVGRAWRSSTNWSKRIPRLQSPGLRRMTSILRNSTVVGPRAKQPAVGKMMATLPLRDPGNEGRFRTDFSIVEVRDDRSGLDPVDPRFRVRQIAVLEPVCQDSMSPAFDIRDQRERFPAGKEGSALLQETGA